MSEAELKKQERLRALKEKREKLQQMRDRKKNREVIYFYNKRFFFYSIIKIFFSTFKIE